MRILAGGITALFAFDVGFEIELDRLAELTETAQPLTGRKRTPSHLQFARPPRVVRLSPGIELFGGTAQVLATIYDFGAVSIAYRWSLPAASRNGEPGEGLPIEELPALASELAGTALEADARERVVGLIARIVGAVVRPELSPLVEDYYLMILERFDWPLDAERILADHGETIARALRFETAPLSREHVAEALSTRVSYYEHDLVVVDWNAALICDPEFEDTASVLELMNVELLEARHVDAQLDRRIDGFGALMRRNTPWPVPLRTPYLTTLHDLAELRIDSSVLSERVGNALKLIGDLYLAKIHNAAVQRFYLQEWERTIAGKLELIDDFYEVLADRAHTAQSQALELVVILLIFVELVLALIERG